MSKKNFVSQGCNFEMDTLLDGKPMEHFEGWRDMMMMSDAGKRILNFLEAVK